MEKVNQELANIQEIRDALVDMKGLTKAQRGQIAIWLKCSMANGFKMAAQENGEDTLQEAMWNFQGC
jgi:hypothetical protein